MPEIAKVDFILEPHSPRSQEAADTIAAEYFLTCDINAG